jgi:hypothetical protein
MPDVRSHPRYWKIVQTVRAIITFPLVAIAFLLVTDLVAGRLESTPQRLVPVVIFTCLGCSLSGLIVTVHSLQRLRRDLRGPSSLWIDEELHQFIKDVISFRGRAQI